MVGIIICIFLIALIIGLLGIFSGSDETIQETYELPKKQSIDLQKKDDRKQTTVSKTYNTTVFELTSSDCDIDISIPVKKRISIEETSANYDDYDNKSYNYDNSYYDCGGSYSSDSYSSSSSDCGGYDSSCDSSSSCDCSSSYN